MTENDLDTVDPEAERRLRNPDRKDLDWVRERILKETALRCDDSVSGCGDTLYALCFLLYLLGDAEDSRLIYAAKRANMDCGCMIDSGLLSMRRTLAELKAVLDPTQDAGLLEDLDSLFSRPGEVEAAGTNLRCYFRAVLNSST